MDCDIKEIRKMSFSKLRDELYNCNNDPVKELIIRKIMKQKYLICKNRKKVLEENKRKKEDEQIKLMNMKRRITNENKRKMAIAEMLVNDIDEAYDNDDFLNDIVGEDDGPQEKLSDLYDNKFNEELNKDFMNNYLMDRMNSEIDIRSSKKKKEKDFVPPFSDTRGDKYASFHTDEGIISPTDFSSKRIIRR